MRPLPAPIASLTEISLCRASPRARSRFATLEHPTSMNRSAAAISISRPFLAPPTTRSRTEFNRIVRSRFVAGSSDVSASLIEVRSCRACASVTPGFSRAIAPSPPSRERLNGAQNST